MIPSNDIVIFLTALMMLVRDDQNNGAHNKLEGMDKSATAFWSPAPIS